MQTGYNSDNHEHQVTNMIKNGVMNEPNIAKSTAIDCLKRCVQQIREAETHQVHQKNGFVKGNGAGEGVDLDELVKNFSDLLHKMDKM